MNKVTKKEDPRTRKMGNDFFSTIQPFVPNVVSMRQKNSSTNFAAYVQ